MTRARDESEKKPFAPKRALSSVVVVLNVMLLAVAVLFYGLYIDVYQKRLREENLRKIANLNQSAAQMATALIDSWGIKLGDVAAYIEHNPMTEAQALVLLEQSNSSTEREFELIGSDYTGFLARKGQDGQFVSVSYRNAAYAELKRAVDDVHDSAFRNVCFAPEFTDGSTARKSFAIYRHLPLLDETGESRVHTLMLVARSADVLAAFNTQNEYEYQATVLVDETGNYIVSSDAFRSDNFFQYLYVYNDLTLDQQSAVIQQVRQSGEGELYYRDALGRDCVFRYERMATNNWYCVTSVPVSSFRALVFPVSYIIYACVAVLILFCVDVSWLRRMNRRLRQSVQREKEASEAKTDFLSRMSHDIRTPLNGIIGLTALAAAEPTSSRGREYLNQISVSGQFLTGLVNDILDMSKVESGMVELHPEAYTCGDLCRYVDAVVRPLCQEKGQMLVVPPPDQERPVLLDRLRFNQIVFNLLSNAVKYTPPGGRVELSWARTNRPDGLVELEITVSDTGVGMSEEFQKHMFEPFTQERSQNAAVGTGLGLAIIHSLVRLMNGSIRVKSQPGVGSAFTVHVETTACDPAAEAPAQETGVPLTGKRVLICEDNPVNTLVAQRLLEQWGVQADVAENGKLGLERFAASALWTYDAILMDVMMPEMNGLDASRAIRQMDRADATVVPILAMTANAYDSDVQNCLNAGMNAHMGKPIDPKQLQALLSVWIGRAERHENQPTPPLLEERSDT